MTRGYGKIYFDGGCRPNPGRMETAIVFRGRAMIDRDAGYGDSIDAEWHALLRAATLARSLAPQPLILLGDNATVIAQANGLQRCRTDALRAHLAGFRTVIAGLTSIRVRHIRRTQNLAGIALARTDR